MHFKTNDVVNSYPQTYYISMYVTYTSVKRNGLESALFIRFGNISIRFMHTESSCGVGVIDLDDHISVDCIHWQ